MIRPPEGPPNSLQDQYLKSLAQVESGDATLTNIAQIGQMRLQLYQYNLGVLDRNTDYNVHFGVIDNQAVLYRYHLGMRGDNYLSHEIWVMAIDRGLQEFEYNNGIFGKDEVEVGYRSWYGWDKTKRAVYEVKDDQAVFTRFDEFNEKPTLVMPHRGQEPQVLSYHSMPVTAIDRQILYAYHWLENEQVTEIHTFPNEFDMKTWRERLLDPNNYYLTDPRMGWMNWFQDLGVRFETNSRPLQ